MSMKKVLIMEFSPSFPENFDGRIGLMVLGEAPGAEEEKQGLPFEGASGKLLMSVLEEYGFTRKNIYISTVFWERPPDNDVSYFFTKKTSNEEKAIQFPLFKNMYLKKEWENQIYRLNDEIEMINPEMILTVGATPLWALRGQDQVSSLRGNPYLVNGAVKNKYTIMFPTFHPAYVLRNGSKMDKFKQDIAKVKELLETPPWEWPRMFGREYDEAF